MGATSSRMSRWDGASDWLYSSVRRAGRIRRNTTSHVTPVANKYPTTRSVLAMWANVRDDTIDVPALCHRILQCNIGAHMEVDEGPSMPIITYSRFEQACSSASSALHCHSGANTLR